MPSAIDSLGLLGGKLWGLGSSKFGVIFARGFRGSSRAAGAVVAFNVCPGPLLECRLLKWSLATATCTD